jgi:hypothetical protein
MRLISPATLQVALVNQPVTGNVCDPTAQGGYLGADNQLIRVQISAVGSGGGKLLWGYNNASFLHRAKLPAPNAAELDLLTTPVDSYHAPQANHPIEILRCAMQLSDDASVNVFDRDYVAASTGLVVTPTAAISEDLKSLTLPVGALTANYSDNSRPLFVRLWEQELTFTAGQPVTLTGTGLSVTIDLGGSAGALTIGQSWSFAARPNTPAEIYPHRYLQAPQPPDGPLLWACPLATIGWEGTTLSVLEDCRAVFDNLVELTKRHEGGCICSITAGPSDNLQALINAIPDGADAHICLKLGHFALRSTVSIANKGHILLHGSGPGTVLRIASGETALRVVGCASFTARDCGFEAGRAGDGNNGLAHLAGALTVADCPRVDLARLTLSCAPATRRCAAGLSITNAKPAGTTAVVEHCTIGAGHLQVGILVVNVETARIRDNAVAPAGDLPPGLSKQQRRDVSKLLLLELRAVDQKVSKEAAKATAPAAAAAGNARSIKSEPAPAAAGNTNFSDNAPIATGAAVLHTSSVQSAPIATISVAGNAFSFRNEPSLGVSAANWQRFVSATKPPQTMTAQAAKRWLFKAVLKAVGAAAGDKAPRSNLRRAGKALISSLSVTPSQGIVVAGSHIGDLAVTGNVVRQALQGIHVGTSQKATATPVFADRVSITGNAVTVPRPLGTLARHGIFIGNCLSPQIADNRIEGVRSAVDPTVPEGIRVFGVLGPFAVVRANHMTGLRTGIKFNPVGTIPERPQWIVTDNLAEHAQDIVVTPNAVVRSRIRGLADNYA